MPNAENLLVSALHEGTFSVGLDKKFKRISPNDPPYKGALKLSINPFLIKYDNRVVLFDTGLGEFGENTTLETIRKNLERHHVSPWEVTDIFISHMHYDHLGGLAGIKNGYHELTFPEAKLWLNRREWERTRNLDGATDIEQRRKFFHFLDAHATLEMVEGEMAPYPEIHVKEVGGHTEHSQVIFFETDQAKYLMAGDIIGRKLAVQQKYTAKFDHDPEKSLEVRESLKRLALEEGYIIMAYHQTETPLFRLTDYDSKHGYRTEPVDSA